MIKKQLSFTLFYMLMLTIRQDISRLTTGEVNGAANRSIKIWREAEISKKNGARPAKSKEQDSI